MSTNEQELQINGYICVESRNRRFAYSFRDNLLTVYSDDSLPIENKNRINIEFNTIDDINSFYRFVVELVPRFKEADLIVAVTLNNNLEKSRLENIVDYIIEK